MRDTKQQPAVRLAPWLDTELYFVAFSKTKSSHESVGFLFWKPASTYSPGHVSASHIVLFFATRHKVPSALACAQCVPFRVVKMRGRSPRSSFRRNYRVAHSFSLRVRVWLDTEQCFVAFFKTKSTQLLLSAFCFGNRHRHTLPGRVQPSTICADELNFCVRYENRWDLIAIDTGNC